MRDELQEARIIRIDGVPQKYTQRRLVAKLMVANALEKKSEKGLSLIYEHAKRLFPDVQPAEVGPAPLGDMSLDEAILRQLFAGLNLGEPKEGASDPLIDLLREPLGPESADNEDGWGEGDWNGPGKEPADD